jgi:hypothetical protein
LALMLLAKREEGADIKKHDLVPAFYMVIGNRLL